MNGRDNASSNVARFTVDRALLESLLQGDRPTEAAVSLLPSHTEITAVRLVAQTEDGTVELSGTMDAAFDQHIDLSSLEVPRNADVELVVEYTGERVAPTSTPLQPREPQRHDDHGDMTIAQWFASRRAEIEADDTISEATRRALLFFLELDAETKISILNETLGATHANEEIEYRTWCIRACATVLHARLSHRFHRAAVVVPSLQLPRQHTSYLSALQLEILSRHFDGADGDLDRGAVFEAFGKFATGQLRFTSRVRHSDAEPQSAFLFFFAEFAAMAIEQHVDEHAWQQLLGPFVAVQPLYVQAYRSSDRMSFNDFGITETLHAVTNDSYAAAGQLMDLDTAELLSTVAVNARNAFHRWYG